MPGIPLNRSCNMVKTLIIAEAGVNHNGDLAVAKEMISTAKKCGADVIKFQAFNPRLLASENAPQAVYQIKNTGRRESQLEMLKKLALNENALKVLLEYCRKNNIGFLSSPFDLKSIATLHNLGLKTLKIPSGEITNYPYLKKIGELNKNLLLSTGMSSLGDIDSALTVLTNFGTSRDNITLLHCTTEYPAPLPEVNLLAIRTLKEAFKLPVGYSDHTKGIEIALAAVAMGAVVIEKHFTLDKQSDGPDHKASLNPQEFEEMTRAIRNIEISFGNGLKFPSPSEGRNKYITRKSIVAANVIKKGDVFSISNLTTKRPGFGLNPMLWPYLIGKKAIRNYKIDEMIEI